MGQRYGRHRFGVGLEQKMGLPPCCGLPWHDSGWLAKVGIGEGD